MLSFFNPYQPTPAECQEISRLKAKITNLRSVIIKSEELISKVDSDIENYILQLNSTPARLLLGEQIHINDIITSYAHSRFYRAELYRNIGLKIKLMGILFLSYLLFQDISSQPQKSDTSSAGLSAYIFYVLLLSYFNLLFVLEYKKLRIENITELMQHTGLVTDNHLVSAIEEFNLATEHLINTRIHLTRTNVGIYYHGDNPLPLAEGDRYIATTLLNTLFTVQAHLENEKQKCQKQLGEFRKPPEKRQLLTLQNRARSSLQL